MQLTPRREAIQAKVLAACKLLLGMGQCPTGVALAELCPGHAQPLLIRIRDQFVESREIDPTVLWPAWTDEYVYTEGAEPGWRPKPPRHKRRDARRTAMEGRP